MKGGCGATPPVLTPFYSTGPVGFWTDIKGDVDGIPSPDSRKNVRAQYILELFSFWKLPSRTLLYCMLWWSWHCLFSIACCAVLRIRHVNPGSWFYTSRFLGPGSQIPDSRIQQRVTKQEKISCLIFLWQQILQKRKLFKFWIGTENNLSQLTKNNSTFYPRNFL